MEYINCILCDEDNSEKILTAEDLRYNTSGEKFNLIRCRRCGLTYINPRPTKDEIKKYYPSRYKTRKILKNPVLIEKRLKQYRRKRISLFFKNPWYIDLPIETTVLDVGCGAGDLLLLLKERGCNAYGIDVDEITCTYLSETMNLNVINCDIDNGTSFQAGFFDLVIMRHSLEHLHNPVNVLHEVRRIMKPGGLLIVGVPNIESYVSKITKEKWRDLDIPRHLFHFNQSTITALLYKSGFSIESIHHELKVSSESLKDWMAAVPLPVFILTSIKSTMRIISSIVHKGEWIVVKARKNNTKNSKYQIGSYV